MQNTRSRQTTKPNRPALTFQRLTPKLMDDLGTVLSGSWGAGCWCVHPRLTAAQTRELPSVGSQSQRRRVAMTALARRKLAPGVLAFEGDAPVGWVAIAPRRELKRIETSRATPRVDDVEVWVIPCITVRKAARGRGIAVALIRAAVAYAGENGAEAVEAYPRAGSDRSSDDSVYFGTEVLFRRAGFRVIRDPIEGLPRKWLPRVTMRTTKVG